MTRFVAPAMRRDYWVSYEGCSGAASSSPTDTPPGAWSNGPPGCAIGMEVQLHEGREDLEVVGEASYQDNLWSIVGGRRSPDGRVREDVYAVLAAEPDNSYDANAVAVWIQGLKVGYLSREDALRYRPGLLALEQQHGKPIALAGVIAGGGMRADGPGRLGVFLEHDPADFGPSSDAHELTIRVDDADRSL